MYKTISDKHTLCIINKTDSSCTLFTQKKRKILTYLVTIATHKNLTKLVRTKTMFNYYSQSQCQTVIGNDNEKSEYQNGSLGWHLAVFLCQIIKLKLK